MGLRPARLEHGKHFERHYSVHRRSRLRHPGGRRARDRCLRHHALVAEKPAGLKGAFCMNSLTTKEASQLAQYEAIIERGLSTFLEVGVALLSIRDARLYRNDYKTFEDYCRQHWKMSRRRANQLIEATEVSKNLGTMVPILPTGERQLRPLAQLPAEQQAAAWERAIDTAPEGKITAAHIENVVEEFKGNGREMKPKTNRAGDIYTPNGYDACQTPAYALDPLLPYLPGDWTIWEPACGENFLVDALYDAGRKVATGDILTGQNFFEYQPSGWDCQITNPPYSIKYDWLTHSYELQKPFALLLPVETLGAKTAQILFSQYGVEVIFLDKRVNFKMPNRGWDRSGAQFPVAWFTCKLNIGAQMIFAHIEYSTEEQE